MGLELNSRDLTNSRAWFLSIYPLYSIPKITAIFLKVMVATKINPASLFAVSKGKSTEKFEQ